MYDVPSPCYFGRGLSLALKLHDQNEATKKGGRTLFLAAPLATPAEKKVVVLISAPVNSFGVSRKWYFFYLYIYKVATCD